jgi:NADPH2:quinone reductase
VDVIELGAKGSLFLTRPAIMHYMVDREDRLAAAKDLFEVVENGAVRIAVNHLYPLSEAAAKSPWCQ